MNNKNVIRFDEVDVDEAKAALKEMDARIAEAHKTVENRFGLSVANVKRIVYGRLSLCAICGDRAIGSYNAGGSHCYACGKGGQY